LPFIIWLVVCGVISASIYWKRRIATAVGTRGKEIRFIGLMTYPLYLVHLQVGGFSMTQAIVAGVPFWSALLAGAAASLVAAWIITAYAEPTLRRIVMRMLALVFLGGRQSPLNKDERPTNVS
jgi:peptidoglycan/LPS O-acetylase OafA/YrhL